MVDPDTLVDAMTLAEKVALTAGADFWSTVGIDRLGVPSVRMTDGPSGARSAGPAVGGTSRSATCMPCGTALGATWDPGLLERVGAMIGGDARAKGCRVLLAPTVNLHRSPLGGRNFESYAEDPVLAGRLAAAFVRGVQAQGVVATVKHFAGNESEVERMTMDSVIDERTLRELYLLPFELAVRDGHALGVMTAYNKLNGIYCSDHSWLLRTVLRGEWAFGGFVVTDWGARGTTVAAARAGVDVEMPGPGKYLGRQLHDAVRAGEVSAEVVDASARRLLRVFARIGALSTDEPRSLVDESAGRVLAREAAAAGTVLLRNDDRLLPLDLTSIRSIAVVGPNADCAEIMGGGSANLPAPYLLSPLQALRDRFGDLVEIVHEHGADGATLAPLLTRAQLTGADGRPGISLEIYDGHDLAGPIVERQHRPDSLMSFFDPTMPAARPAFSARATATYTPATSGHHVFSLAQLGRARLLIDGDVVIDGMADPPPPGSTFIGFGSVEMSAVLDLDEGAPVDLVVEFANVDTEYLSGARLGCRPPADPALLERAVAVAADADIAIVFVGTDADWECEGYDRISMSLPGRQNELVQRVLAVNPRTVVVVNTGSVVTLPWTDQAPAVLQVWFGGQEMANALVDILAGDVDPGGRLPTTIPLALKDTPVFGNFHADNGRLCYDEGLFIGYRWYESRGLPMGFSFGHGLSYTTFTIGVPALSASTFTPGDELVIKVPVTNTGHRRGHEVVQCYVAPPSSRLPRPVKELKAFAKVTLGPGETAVVCLALDERAFAYWDSGGGGWTVEAGQYDVLVGRSSTDIAHVVHIGVSPRQDSGARPG